MSVYRFYFSQQPAVTSTCMCKCKNGNKNYQQQSKDIKQLNVLVDEDLSLVSKMCLPFMFKLLSRSFAMHIYWHWVGSRKSAVKRTRGCFKMTLSVAVEQSVHTADGHKYVHGCQLVVWWLTIGKFSKRVFFTQPLKQCPSLFHTFCLISALILCMWFNSADETVVLWNGGKKIDTPYVPYWKVG